MAAEGGDFDDDDDDDDEKEGEEGKRKMTTKNFMLCGFVYT
jgi:hypothetical protein